MLDRLGEDAALEVATRVNTLENVRITFDHKVEQVIQEIVDLNFDLYKRITDDPAFGEVGQELPIRSVPPVCTARLRNPRAEGECRVNIAPH